MADVALYLIKPEAIRYSQDIRSRLKEAGLFIEFHRLVVLDEQTIMSVYRDLSADIMNATLRHLIGQECELGIVRGESAISKLLIASGLQTSPAACHFSSIRHIYGVKEPDVAGTGVYWRNAIHRTKSIGEVEENMKAFSNHLRG